MAKDNAKDSALATKRDTTQLGTFLPSDFESFIAGEGFSSIETVMIGSPDDGKFPYYIGRLIGPGADIEMDNADGKTSKLPTWSFHPAIKLDNGKIGFADNVTHVLPAPYMIHAACVRIFEQANRSESHATVGLIFEGQQKTRKNRPLNRYRVFEKYSAK
jgi:hypothetical protein